MITELKRAIWQIPAVTVYDGGADASGTTHGDNTPFAASGVFFP